LSDITYSVPPKFAAQANLTPESYKEAYEKSLSDPEGFWAEQATRIDWMTRPTQIK